MEKEKRKSPEYKFPLTLSTELFEELKAVSEETGYNKTSLIRQYLKVKGEIDQKRVELLANGEDATIAVGDTKIIPDLLTRQVSGRKHRTTLSLSTVEHDHTKKLAEIFTSNNVSEYIRGAILLGLEIYRLNKINRQDKVVYGLRLSIGMDNFVYF